MYVLGAKKIFFARLIGIFAVFTHVRYFYLTHVRDKQEGPRALECSPEPWYVRS